MRISDWSSDVCSSDLCIPISGAGLRARMPVVGVIEKLSERYAVPSDHRRHVSWDSHRRRPMMSEPFDPADTDAWIAHGRSPVQAAALADAWRRFPDLANASPLDQRMARLRERVTA